MSEQLSTEAAKVQAASDYGELTSKDNERKALEDRMNHADHMAATLFGELNRRREFVMSGGPVIEGDKEMAHDKMLRAEGYQEQAAGYDVDMTEVGLHADKIAADAADNYNANKDAYHAAALEDAADKGVAIKR